MENKTNTKMKKKTLSNGFRASKPIVFHVGEFLGRLLYKIKKILLFVSETLIYQNMVFSYVGEVPN